MCRINLRFAVAAVVCSIIASSVTAQSAAFDLTRMDRSVSACDDFYQFANGNWMKTTEIPAGYPRWGTLDMLGERSSDALRGILDEAAKKKAAPGSDAQLAGDFYYTCTDLAAIEKAGAAPLDPYLKQIERIRTAKDLPEQIARMHNVGTSAIFGFSGTADAKNSSMNIAVATQGGLSLPDRDFYTATDAKSVETRTKFVEHMTNMFKLLGDDPAKAAANANTVLAFQTRLASAHQTAVALRDPQKRYNKITVAKLSEITPNFDWARYFKMRGAPQFDEINVVPPEFFAEVNRMATEVPIADWKTYLRWMTLTNSASNLSKAFADEDFNFSQRYLHGVQEPRPRWSDCVAATDGLVGDALGAEYVKRNFTPASEKRMNEMIDNLFTAFRESIQNLDRMSPATKDKALVKLAAYQRKIGFNKNPQGYAGLKLDRRSYFENLNRLAELLIARGVKDIGQPVDRTRWAMTAPTINAYYNPRGNEIVFPAGILQPPVFNSNADDAINYGAIGSVIGHEMTHGFDDSGSQFDEKGNLKMWWTPDDRKKFEERADCIISQFSGYEVQPTVHISGKLTEGENIADLGGITMAWAAYQKSLQGKPKPPNIDGFTPEQRFFLGWAQVWTTKETPEYERTEALTDSHANARFRINGPLSNLPQFRQAFGCKAGDKMVRATACKIW